MAGGKAVEGFKRINQTRTEQLLEVNPDTVIVNCPYCMTMITDGVKEVDQEGKIPVLDICELLWQCQE